MISNRIALIGILIGGLCGICQAKEEQKVIAAGEWSKPVGDTRGYAVRGRLVLAERRVSDERREAAVYVELQDASEAIGGGMRIFCNLGKADVSGESNDGLKCEMHDKDNRPVASTGYPFGGATPRSEWVYLPSDATIRLRASPFGVYRQDALAITPQLNVLWVIADNDPNEYFLSGTLTVNPELGRKSIEDPQIWRGTLVLPAVRIVNRRN